MKTWRKIDILTMVELILFSLTSNINVNAFTRLGLD